MASLRIWINVVSMLLIVLWWNLYPSIVNVEPGHLLSFPLLTKKRNGQKRNPQVIVISLCFFYNSDWHLVLIIETVTNNGPRTVFAAEVDKHVAEINNNLLGYAQNSTFRNHKLIRTYRNSIPLNHVIQLLSFNRNGGLWTSLFKYLTKRYRTTMIICQNIFD